MQFSSFLLVRVFPSLLPRKVERRLPDGCLGCFAFVGDGAFGGAPLLLLEGVAAGWIEGIRKSSLLERPTVFVVGASHLGKAQNSSAELPSGTVDAVCFGGGRLRLDDDSFAKRAEGPRRRAISLWNRRTMLNLLVLQHNKSDCVGNRKLLANPREFVGPSPRPEGVLRSPVIPGHSTFHSHEGFSLPISIIAEMVLRSF